MSMCRRFPSCAILLLCAALTSAADHPRWRGDGTGAVPDPGVPLVEGWDEVAVAWCSEPANPHPWNFSVVRGHTQWPRTVLGNGGYSMPAVCDSKVYVSYWRGSGEHHATDGDGKYPKKWVASGDPRYTRIEADQVISCLDARSGRQLWEAVWSGYEMNHVEPYGGHNNPVVADGKVVAIGNTGWAYCADATTGEKLWNAPVGPSHKEWQAFKARCIAEKMKSYKIDSEGVPEPEEPCPPHGGSLASTTYNMCPVVAEGVAVVGEWSRGGGLTGLDLKTGKELWRNPKIGTGVVPPLLWRHGDREYLVKADSVVTCLDPKTGKVLWSGGKGGNAGYDAATPAIKGDLLVMHGDWKDQRKQFRGQPEKWEGWVCYRMGPEGLKQVWSLDGAYQGTMYIAPVIVGNHVWLPFQREPGSKGHTDLRTDRNRHGVACVELTTGKVLSESLDIQFQSVCPGPVAMGDLLFYIDAKSALLAKLDPVGVRSYGTVGQPINYCSSATVADGLAFFRGGERLVVALDLRSPSARPRPVVAADPARGRFDLVLAKGQRAGQDLHVHLVGRDGSFAQSWATVPPHFRHPDPLVAKDLRFADGRLTGRIVSWPGSVYSEHDLDCTVTADGSVTGTFTDVYPGEPVRGEAVGTMRARADRNCSFTMMWPRAWWGGQNQGHEHKVQIEVKDGKVLTPVFSQRRDHTPTFTVEVLENGLAYADGRLGGILKIKTGPVGDGKGYIRDGICAITFQVAVEHDLLGGSVRTAYDGTAPADFPVEGSVAVPETVRVAADDAVFSIVLPGSVAGKTDLTLKMTSSGERVPTALTVAHGCAGRHRTRAGALKVVDGRITGRVELDITGDGYLLKSSYRARYDLDLAIDGPDVTGTYTGVWDAREPKTGEVTGTCTEP